MLPFLQNFNGLVWMDALAVPEIIAIAVWGGVANPNLE